MQVSRCIVLLAASLACLSTVACDRGAQPSQTRTVAPDFSLDDGTAKVHLKDYRGKIVVLNFWATWCPPCVEELPSLMELQRLNPQIKVLAISTDEDAQAYKRFLVDHHVTLTTVRDAQQKSADLYNTERFPETYVIDREGIIRRKFIGPQQWTSSEIQNYLHGL